MKLVFFETPIFSRLLRSYLTADRQIWFFTIYNKDEAADLSQDEKKALKKAIHNELSLRRSSDD